MCQAFGCRPTEAVEELAKDPEQLALQILELRAYADAKAVVDASPRLADVPMTEMVQCVLRNQAVLLREAAARRR